MHERCVGCGSHTPELGGTKHVVYNMHKMRQMDRSMRQDPQQAHGGDALGINLSNGDDMVVPGKDY